MSFKITIQNAERLSKRFLDKKAQQGVISAGVDRNAEVLVKATRANAPRKSGRLAAGIHKKQVNQFGWEVREREKYGIFVREGTSQRTIYPGQRKAIYWPGAEHPVAYVNHPGSRPNSYDQDAVSSSRGNVAAEVTRLGKLVIEEVIK